MESSRGKIIVVIIVLAIVAVVSAVLPSLLNSTGKDNSYIGPWKSPTGTSSITSTATIEPSQIDAAIPEELTKTPIPPTDSANSCIHTVIYWAEHLDIWPASVNISNLSYTKDKIVSIFNEPSDDLAANLFIQVHAAFLNLTNGAQNFNIEKLLLDAANWIVLNPIGSELTDSDQRTGFAFETILADFNNGRLGPGLCENETIYASMNETLSSISELPTETTVFIATRMLSRTPTRTNTPIPPRRPNPPTSTPQQTSLPIQTQIPTNVPTTPQIVTQTPEPVLPTPAPEIPTPVT